MPNLARSLNVILVDHIKSMLPALRSKMEDAIAARQRELRLYGDAPPGNTNAARWAGGRGAAGAGRGGAAAAAAALRSAALHGSRSHYG